MRCGNSLIPPGSSRVRALRTIFAGFCGVRLPECHLGDAVGLGDDPLREAEGLEGLDAPGLDAVGLADGEPSGAALHDPGGDARELGQLGGREHTCGPGAHDEHVHLVRKLGGAVDADAGSRLDARVTGYVSVVVEMHGLSSLRCVAACRRLSCSIIEFSVR